MVYSLYNPFMAILGMVYEIGFTTWTYMDHITIHYPKTNAFPVQNDVIFRWFGGSPIFEKEIPERGWKEVRFCRVATNNSMSPVRVL